MFANGGARRHMMTTEVKPWYYLQKLGFLHSNQKSNTSARKSWVFPTLVKDPQQSPTNVFSRNMSLLKGSPLRREIGPFPSHARWPDTMPAL